MPQKKPETKPVEKSIEPKEVFSNLLVIGFFKTVREIDRAAKPAHKILPCTIL